MTCIVNTTIDNSPCDTIIGSASNMRIVGSSISGATGCAIKLLNRSNCTLDNSIIGAPNAPNNNNGILLQTGSSISIGSGVSGYNMGLGVLVSEGGVMYFSGAPSLTGSVGAIKIGSNDPDTFSSQDDMTVKDEHYSYSKRVV